VRWERLTKRATAIAVIATLAFVFSFPIGLRLPLVAAVDQVVTGETAPEHRVPRLQGTLSPDEPRLAEDASIPVSLGQLPVVLDPFMLGGSPSKTPAFWIGSSRVSNAKSSTTSSWPGA
jgi:hypothetical protein